MKKILSFLLLTVMALPLLAQDGRDAKGMRLSVFIEPAEAGSINSRTMGSFVNGDSLTIPVGENVLFFAAPMEGYRVEKFQVQTLEGGIVTAAKAGEGMLQVQGYELEATLVLVLAKNSQGGEDRPTGGDEGGQEGGEEPETRLMSVDFVINPSQLSKEALLVCPDGQSLAAGYGSVDIPYSENMTNLTFTVRTTGKQYTVSALELQNAIGSTISTSRNEKMDVRWQEGRFTIFATLAEAQGGGSGTVTPTEQYMNISLAVTPDALLKSVEVSCRQTGQMLVSGKNLTIPMQKYSTVTLTASVPKDYQIDRFLLIDATGSIVATGRDNTLECSTQNGTFTLLLELSKTQGGGTVEPVCGINMQYAGTQEPKFEYLIDEKGTPLSCPINVVSDADIDTILWTLWSIDQQVMVDFERLGAGCTSKGDSRNKELSFDWTTAIIPAGNYMLRCYVTNICGASRYLEFEVRPANGAPVKRYARMHFLVEPAEYSRGAGIIFNDQTWQHGDSTIFELDDNQSFRYTFSATVPEGCSLDYMQIFNTDLKMQIGGNFDQLPFDTWLQEGNLNITLKLRKDECKEAIVENVGEAGFLYYWGEQTERGQKKQYTLEANVVSEQHATVNWFLRTLDGQMTSLDQYASITPLGQQQGGQEGADEGQPAEDEESSSSSGTDGRRLISMYDGADGGRPAGGADGRTEYATMVHATLQWTSIDLPARHYTQNSGYEIICRATTDCQATTDYSYWVTVERCADFDINNFSTSVRSDENADITARFHAISPDFKGKTPEVELTYRNVKSSDWNPMTAEAGFTIQHGTQQEGAILYNTCNMQFPATLFATGNYTIRVQVTYNEPYKYVIEKEGNLAVRGEIVVTLPVDTTLNDSTIKIDQNTGILTFRNLNTEKMETPQTVLTINDVNVTIMLEGDNEVEGEDTGFEVTQDVTIRSKEDPSENNHGKITISAQKPLYSPQPQEEELKSDVVLTLDSTELVVTIPEETPVSARHAAYCAARKAIMKDDYSVISGFSGLELIRCEIVEPVGAHYDVEKRELVDINGDNVKHAHIMPLAPATPTADQAQTQSDEVRKLMKNGQLYIIRDGKLYNALGTAL